MIMSVYGTYKEALTYIKQELRTWEEQVRDRLEILIHTPQTNNIVEKMLGRGQRVNICMHQELL